MTVNLIRPDADDAVGGWTNELNSTPLYVSIDETVASDTDYIKSEADPAVDIARFRLSNPAFTTAPPAKLRIRFKRSGTGVVDLTVRVMEGSVPIVEYVYTDIADTFVDIEETLTSGEYASITDFNNLYVELQADAGVDFPLAGAAVDLKFTTSEYYDGAPGADVTTLLSCSRASIGYAQTVAGTLTQFAANDLRITDKGLLIEDARTNVVLWNRDLTNGAWTASNVTAAKNQTGPDGVSNSASSITASAGNGTILQAITLGSSARYQSAWVKRLTGSGTINMTMDNGSTWTAITVTADWTRVEISTQTLANPTVGFRIVTNGDAIAVDFVQNEDGTFASSPILTTTAAATRAADVVQTLSTLATVLQGAAMSVCVDSKFIASPLNMSFPRLIGDGGGGARDDTPLFAYSTDDTLVGIYDNSVPLPATIGNSLKFVDGVKVASSWSSGARSVVGGGGTVATDANGRALITAPVLSYAPNPSYVYFRRLTAWDTKLADATLQGFTNP